MVKEFAAVDNTVQIKKLLKVLGEDFATSQNPHVRKGGLLGLAATSIALGKVSVVMNDLQMLIYFSFLFILANQSVYG